MWYDMDAIPIAIKMSDLDFFIHILNNVHELYNVGLGGMENRLMLKESNSNKLTLEQVRKKLKNIYGHN